MSALVDRITAVLREHPSEVNNANGTGWWSDCGCDDQDALCFPSSELADNHYAAHVAERIAAEAVAPELGELEATKLLLAATQEQLSRTIADFCAVRDALPRKQVEQILAAVEPKPAEEMK